MESVSDAAGPNNIVFSVFLSVYMKLVVGLSVGGQLSRVGRYI